jgi:pimeloyl-ACP methyl ester carboxylesterase
MMRSITICLTLLLTATFTLAQATEQTIDKNMIARVQRYYNNNQPDSLYKHFDPIMKSSMDMAKTTALFSQMHAQLGNLKQTTFVEYNKGAAAYKSDFENDELVISLATNNLKQISGLYFKPYKAPAAVAEKLKEKETPAVAQTVDPSVTEYPLVAKTLGGTFHGTLTIPKDAPAKMPVVLIIPGTGSIDRNGNSVTLGINGNTYKYIAEGLGKAGIACLRYDKRNVGQSTSSGKETDSKFTDYVNDASAFLLLLKDDPRFSKFIILGHSEGSLLAMITAYTEPVSGIISVEASGVPVDQMLTEQMKSKPPAVQDEFKNIIDSLKKGKTTPKVDPSLYSVARPSLQNYLMSWIPYDPARVIKKIKTSFLIVQGTTDLQSSVTDAEKLKKAKSDATLKIIDGMNYILKEAPADKEKNMATYSNPSLPLKPEFMTAVVDFIKALK